MWQNRKGVRSRLASGGEIICENENLENAIWGKAEMLRKTSEFKSCKPPPIVKTKQTVKKHVHAFSIWWTAGGNIMLNNPEI